MTTPRKPPRRRYTLLDRDSGVTESCGRVTLAGARRRAADWAAEGSWDLSGGTIWVDVSILRPGRPGREPAWERIIETLTVAIDPDPPRCESDEGEHDWRSPIELVGGCRENPGVFGHGAGVVIHEACMRCGARRVTDTWAQRPDTGEQGLESVAYDGPGYYDLPEAARS